MTKPMTAIEFIGRTGSRTNVTGENHNTNLSRTR